MDSSQGRHPLPAQSLKDGQAPGPPPVPEPLKRFIWDIQSMVELTDDEREILLVGRDLMARLVACDDWLPSVFTVPDPARRQQFQLYADGLERFSVVASILAAGQILHPALDPVWEIIGLLRGSAALGRIAIAPDGRPAAHGFARQAPPEIMRQGSVAAFRSANRDALSLGNELEDSVTVAIHVYGGELTKFARRTFTAGGEALTEPARYANPAHAPPYDIFSIQTRIED